MTSSTRRGVSSSPRVYPVRRASRTSRSRSRFRNTRSIRSPSRSERSPWPRRARRQGTLAPDRRLAEPELREVPLAQVRFPGAVELVELRRLYARSGKHRMRLAAVMDLVLKEVREETAQAIGSRAVAARNLHHGVQAVLAERFAQRDQAQVGRALLGGDLAAGVERLLGIEEAPRIA